MLIHDFLNATTGVAPTTPVYYDTTPAVPVTRGPLGHDHLALVPAPHPITIKALQHQLAHYAPGFHLDWQPAPEETSRPVFGYRIAAGRLLIK